MIRSRLHQGILRGVKVVDRTSSKVSFHSFIEKGLGHHLGPNGPGLVLAEEIFVPSQIGTIYNKVGMFVWAQIKSSGYVRHVVGDMELL
jgi:hypothetical protein